MTIQNLESLHSHQQSEEFNVQRKFFKVNKSPKFLHIGCGQKHKQQTPFSQTNWQEIRLDINKDVQPDIVGSMTCLTAVNNESVDAVFSSHNIEHLYAHEVPIALKEFRRVLKPNGFALITCPDLQTVCQEVANNKLLDALYISPGGPITPMDIIYGHRSSIHQGEEYMAHRCGFTATTLINLLNQTGFTALVMRRIKHFDLWAIASTNNDKKWLREKAIEFFPEDI